MTELLAKSNRKTSQEAMDDHRLLSRVIRLLCCLMATTLLLSALPLSSAAYADDAVHQEASPDTESPEDEALLEPNPKEGEGPVAAEEDIQPNTTPNEGISLTLSEPEVWQEGDMVFYKTTLTVRDAQAFFGYQIEVESDSEESVEVVNMFNGVNTKPVFKENHLYFATLNTTQVSGDIPACEIIAQYPASDTNPNKQLVVRSLQVVTSVSPETIVALGPDPAAIVLDLSASTESAANQLQPLMPLIIIVAVLCLIAAVLTFVLLSANRNRRITMPITEYPKIGFYNI